MLLIHYYPRFKDLPYTDFHIQDTYSLVIGLLKQFYIVSITIIGLLVPYTNNALISRNSVDAKASPFIIAIADAGIQGLDSVMNVVVLIAVLSVGNSSMYGATRTLAALAEQGQAPRILAYYDRKGRPLVAIGIASLVGCISYLHTSRYGAEAFTWLMALSGLSSIFTWASICFAHIQFRKAWAYQGNKPSDLIYKSPIGVIGSWIGLVSLIAILIAQLWVAVDPAGEPAHSSGKRVSNFFAAYLAMPVVIVFYVFYKIWFRPKWVKYQDVDLVVGRNDFESEVVRRQWKEDKSEWPTWKRVYKTLC